MGGIYLCTKFFSRLFAMQTNISDIRIIALFQAKKNTFSDISSLKSQNTRFYHLKPELTFSFKLILK